MRLQSFTSYLGLAVGAVLAALLVHYGLGESRLLSRLSSNSSRNTAMASSETPRIVVVGVRGKIRVTCKTLFSWKEDPFPVPDISQHTGISCMLSPHFPTATKFPLEFLLACNAFRRICIHTCTSVRTNTHTHAHLHTHTHTRTHTYTHTHTRTHTCTHTHVHIHTFREGWQDVKRSYLRTRPARRAAPP